jgi:hypothetical protein
MMQMLGYTGRRDGVEALGSGILYQMNAQFKHDKCIRKGSPAGQGSCGNCS